MSGRGTARLHSRTVLCEDKVTQSRSRTGRAERRAWMPLKGGEVVELSHEPRACADSIQVMDTKAHEGKGQVE